MTPNGAESKDRPVILTEVDAGLVDDIVALIKDGQRGMVLNLVADLYPADLAILMHHLSSDEAETLFGWLPEEKGSEVLPELDDDYRSALLSDIPSEQITELLDNLEADDVADVIADLPEPLAQEVLPLLEDSDEVLELLLYDEESAGGIMGTDLVAVPESMTVGQATEEVRRMAEEVEPLFAVYVTDAAGMLTGVVSLKNLLLSKASALMGAIMTPDVITVDPEMDQEEVARIMERYDLVALPVVDSSRKLIGRITIDDVVDVIREEAEEDIQRMSGVSDEEPTSSVLKVSRGRLIWLMAGLGGAVLSAMVIRLFEHELEKAVVLAMFIPVVMAMAGNAGIQSSAIAVAGLASGDIWETDVLRRLGKELLVALVNGAAIALAIAGIVQILVTAGVMTLEPGRTMVLAGVVAGTLFLVIILAATIGATVPLMLGRAGIDPALATGPFITTSNDILGLIVYFLIASKFYL